MAQMPDWFAKTKEMVAMDHHFSLVGAKSRPELIRRYKAALARLGGEPQTYAKRSDAMKATLSAQQVNLSLGNHFAPDWIHPLYYSDPAQYGSLGGLFWPTIPSATVIGELRDGVELAIHKALGDKELAKLGYTKEYRNAIFTEERGNGVDCDGVIPLVTSWNCVAPTGSDFFDVAALRGPTAVEFAIATPQPYGISMTRRVLSMVRNEQLAPLAPAEGGSPRGSVGRKTTPRAPAQGT